MKKLFSLTALSALLYATSANANFYLGPVFNLHFSLYEFVSFVIPPILLFLTIQALLLHYGLKDISYPQALLAACIGNIPSTLLVALGWASTWHLFSGYVTAIIMRSLSLTYWAGRYIDAFLLALMSSLLMIIMLTIIFRYPVKKLIVPVVLGNIIANFIAVTWIYFIV
jgi:hypothetical protein